MKKTKGIGIVIMIMAIVIVCSGCGATEDLITNYVQWSIDDTYLGKAPQEYLDFVDMTAEQVEIKYKAGVGYEVDYLMSMYDLEDTLDSRARLHAFYTELYSNSKYVVDPATKADDGGYNVKVTVEPVMFIAEHMPELDASLEELLLDVVEKELEATTDEEIEKITNAFYIAYDEMVISFLEEKLATATINYGEPTDMIIQVEMLEDKSYNISNNDFANLDLLILAY